MAFPKMNAAEMMADLPENRRIIMLVTLKDIMQESGVSFGTSGARGLVTALSDRVVYSYVSAFAKYLLDSGARRPGEKVALAGDLRPSTPRIMQAANKALTNNGLLTDFQGFISSPAIAYYGLLQKMPTIMVTGSHIPADRNGIKFTTARGEITKEEEALLARETLDIDSTLFNADGALKERPALPRPGTLAKVLYLRRYWDFFPKNCLMGLKIGLYEHSAVGRELMGEILEGLGATIVRGGYSAAFVPVDTEALSPANHEFAKKMAAQNELFALVSSDGDSDRPLVAAESGTWLKGDIAGIIAARYLKADKLVVPVSVSSIVEQCGYFGEVVRPRIGSPFVIEAMEKLCQKSPKARVMGFEANGGFLLASDIEENGQKLLALPTRDVPLVHISVLLAAKEAGKTISELVKELPPWFTAAGRLQKFPQELGRSKLAELSGGSPAEVLSRLSDLFGHISGKAINFNTIDGLRITFESKEVIHLRASGNAPEFRVYSEGASRERAEEIVARALPIPDSWR